MDRGAWQASPWGRKESDTTEQLTQPSLSSSAKNISTLCLGHSAWTEARVRTEVAAPSCPPGRLPACECLALSHQWALCGEAVCLLPLPLCSP